MTKPYVFHEIGMGVSVWYPPTLYPKIIRFPNDHKFPILFDEKELGASYDYVLIERCEIICVEDAYYSSGVAIDPPVYEPDVFETIIVRPKYRCWGKGA